MKVNIHSQTLTIGADIRAYAEEKLLRLDRHFGRVLDVDLELGADGQQHADVRVAQVRIHLNGTILKAHAEGSTMHEAIDLMIDKADEQLRRHKEKVTAHKGEHLGRLEGELP
ncbi:MAG: ribosome hibernation-promoting factor, HPF/YfiA family [Candidatus Dormibacteria bacterium]